MLCQQLDVAVRVSRAILQAAIYGALAGHLGAVLPACGSWEDAAWALGRCWLEATLDRRLAQASLAVVC